MFPFDALARTASVTHMLIKFNGIITFFAWPILPLCIGPAARPDGMINAASVIHITLVLIPRVCIPAFQHALMHTSYFWGLMELWGGSLVAAVVGVASGEPAFHTVQRLLRPAIRAIAGIGLIAEDHSRFVVGTPWMSQLEAKALAAGVLVVCFGLRTYKAFGLQDVVPPVPWVEQIQWYGDAGDFMRVADLPGSEKQPGLYV